MTKQTKKHKNKNVCKIACAIICAFALLAALFFAIWSLAHPKKANDDNYVSNDISIEKSELKERLETVELHFHSKPRNTEIKFDFNYHTKEVKVDGDVAKKVPYNRFDELYDYLYDHIFPNEEDLQKHSNCCAIESVYDIYATFSGENEIKPLGTSFFSYENTVKHKQQWGLNAHYFMDGWEALMSIAEIDEGTFVSGINGFDIHNNAYEKE
jgi:hypothetical protein